MYKLVTSIKMNIISKQTLYNNNFQGSRATIEPGLVPRPSQSGSKTTANEVMSLSTISS